MIRILGVDLGQGDEGAAVVGPAFELRQLADSELIGEQWPARDLARTRAQQGPRHGGVAQRYFHSAAGSTRSSTSRRTLSSESRKMKRARSMVPKRLLAMGKRQPRTLAKYSAGPPARKTRRWISAISRFASTSCSIRSRWPARARSRAHSRVEVVAIVVFRLGPSLVFRRVSG